MSEAIVDPAPNPPSHQPPTLDYAALEPRQWGWLRYRPMTPGKVAAALTGLGGLYLSVATLAGFEAGLIVFAIVGLIYYAAAVPVMLLALFLPGWRPAGWWRAFRQALGWSLLTMVAISSVHSCPHSLWLTVGPIQVALTGTPCRNPQPHMPWYVRLAGAE